MRIVAGSFRGRVLKAPQGNQTRPTTDRVREALMSSVASELGSFEDICVLDAFAGSGALGLEALSRGAKRAVFFERDRKALAALNANIASLGLSNSSACVYKRDVFTSLEANSAVYGSFDLVFFDPPYVTSPVQIVDLIIGLIDAQALQAGAVVIYEQSIKNSLQSCKDQCERLMKAQMTCARSKRYGETLVDMWVFEPGKASAPENFEKGLE